MELYGKVKNGVIVPSAAASLKEGELVRIERIKKATTAARKSKKQRKETALQRMWRQFGGTVRGPHDWAENHDHYIHGTPKRRR